MKVKELIEELQKCDPDGEVVMDFDEDDVLPQVEHVSEVWDDSEESRYHLRKFNKKWMIVYLESEDKNSDMSRFLSR